MGPLNRNSTIFRAAPRGCAPLGVFSPFGQRVFSLFWPYIYMGRGYPKIFLPKISQILCSLIFEITPWAGNASLKKFFHKYRFYEEPVFFFFDLSSSNKNLGIPNPYSTKEKKLELAMWSSPKAVLARKKSIFRFFRAFQVQKIAIFWFHKLAKVKNRQKTKNFKNPLPYFFQAWAEEHFGILHVGVEKFLNLWITLLVTPAQNFFI